MNKNLAISLFPVNINGSVADPFESEREIEITSDKSTYKLVDELKIQVTFKNYLPKDIVIVNDGYAEPFFILEKKVGDVWEEVYFPTRYTLIPSFVQPTELKTNEEFTAFITIYTNRIKVDNIVGEYRFYFDLMEKESNKMVQDKYLYSNIFKIVGKI
jgi:hypothetical protein